MRRLLLLFAAFVLCASSLDEFGVKIVKFDIEYNAWSRKYFGCPEVGDVSIETCKPHRAQMDYDGYKRTRKRAMELFDLVEKNDK